jgi:nicotinamide-nucleotide amidase
VTVAEQPLLAEAFPEAETLLTRMRAAGLTLAAGESCTGGLLTAALTAFAGSSDVVRGGLVTYADELKLSLAGVRGDVLRTHGAVSAEVARALAAGARRVCDADVGVGITGVAGPGGGSPGKPVGLVFVAVETASAQELVRLDRDLGREENRAAAIRAAMALCLRLIGP